MLLTMAILLALLWCFHLLHMLLMLLKGVWWTIQELFLRANISLGGSLLFLTSLYLLVNDRMIIIHFLNVASFVMELLFFARQILLGVDISLVSSYHLSTTLKLSIAIGFHVWLSWYHIRGLSVSIWILLHWTLHSMTLSSYYLLWMLLIHIWIYSLLLPRTHLLLLSIYTRLLQFSHLLLLAGISLLWMSLVVWLTMMD